MPRLSIAEGEVGKSYVVVVCRLECEERMCAEPCKTYTAEITSRSETHTYLKHANGELALPNDITTDLISLTYEHKTNSNS